MKIIESDNTGDPTIVEIQGLRFERRRFCDGDRIIATRGVRKGELGKVVDPTGVEMSWVAWRKGPPTTYPHDSMALRQTGEA